MQKKHLHLLVFFFLHPAGAGAASVIVNGEFTDGLLAWTATGAVFDTGETAVFTDTLPLAATLFQTSGLENDLLAFEISFDIFNGLSLAAPLGFLPDSFYATLYYGASEFGSSLPGAVYDTAVALFDMDAKGTSNEASGAVFGPSPKGAGWTRFTLTHATAPDFTGPGFATIAFEFYDLNGIASDSVVAVDNVRLTLVLVPEPGAAVMAMLAALLLPLRRRRISSHF